MRNVLMCVLLTCAYGCDDEGSTVTPTTVPPVDMASAPSTDMAAGVGPVADMVSAPTFPTTASVTVGPNNTLTYAPATVDIAAGGTVTWTWAPGITMPHTVTSGDTPPAFPSSPVQMSGTYQATFPTAGTFSYFCTVHGRIMSGTVNVH